MLASERLKHASQMLCSQTKQQDLGITYENFSGWCTHFEKTLGQGLEQVPSSPNSLSFLHFCQTKQSHFCFHGIIQPRKKKLNPESES